MMSMLLCGWNAGSLGPLLPALQSYYNVCFALLITADQSRLAIRRVRPSRDLCMERSDLVVSLIFVGNSVGSLLAGTSNVFITDLIGYRFVRPPPYYYTPHMWPVADQHRQPP